MKITQELKEPKIGTKRTLRSLQQQHVSGFLEASLLRQAEGKLKKCTKSTGLFSTKRWPLDVLTFLIHGFDKNMNKDSKGPKVTRNDYFQLVMKVALTFVFLSWKALPCHGGHAVC